MNVRARCLELVSGIIWHVALLRKRMTWGQLPSVSNVSGGAGAPNNFLVYIYVAVVAASCLVCVVAMLVHFCLRPRLIRMRDMQLTRLEQPALPVSGFSPVTRVTTPCMNFEI